MTNTPPPPLPSTPAVGSLCRIECGAQSADALVDEVERLVASLRGRVVTRVRAADAVVLEASLPAGVLGQFKGALALAGGSFEPGESAEHADAVIVLVGPRLSCARVSGAAS